MIITENHVLKFWDKFTVPENYEKDCWIWNGSINKDGYGVYGGSYKNFLAHRFMYHLYSNKIPIDGWENYNFKEIPNGLFICHHCDNPPCVNPMHLQLGTHEYNMRDMVNKKRSRTGEINNFCKYPDNLILEILEDIKIGKYSHVYQISEKYDIAYETILHILKGDFRKDLTSGYDLPALKDSITTRNMSDDKIRSIKTDIFVNNMRNMDIVKKYNISQAHVSRIRHNKIYQLI